VLCPHMSFSQTAVVKAAEGLEQIVYIRFRSQMIANDGAHKVMIRGRLPGRSQTEQSKREGLPDKLITL
jgi:hypothetical protein